PLSHWGGIEKENLPLSNFTSETGRALPCVATKYPTKVLVPESFTSSQQGSAVPLLSTVISQRPIRSLAATGCSMVFNGDFSPANTIAVDPKAKRLLKPKTISFLFMM